MSFPEIAIVSVGITRLQKRTKSKYDSDLSKSEAKRRLGIK